MRRPRLRPFRVVITDERVSRTVSQKTLHACLRQIGHAWATPQSPEQLQWIYAYLREGR